MVFEGTGWKLDLLNIEEYHWAGQNDFPGNHYSGKEW